MKFNIPEAKIKETYESAVDFMMESDLFSNNAYLYYPPIKIDCPSCSNGNTFGCTNCNGYGFKEVVEKEQIRLRIHFSGKLSFNRQNFRKLGINVEDIKGDVLTLGYCADAGKIKRSNYIQFFEDSEHCFYKYRLISPPTPYGFCRDKFCYSMWERSDGA